jgi:signal transduction histidine kinase
LDQSTAHELLMVVREALHNAVRHGQPTKVQLNITFGENECSVQIHDNGIGFDPALVLSSSNGHYGLVGIRERIKRLGGNFVLNSRSGEGTDLSFRIPRKVSVRQTEMPLV